MKEERSIADKMTDWVLNTIEKLLPDPKSYCKNCGRELIWWGNMERGKWIECECKLK